MLRFLFSRRWLALLLAVVVVGVACVELGRWQLRRYYERRAENVVTERNLAADPQPVDDVLSTAEPPASTEQWRVVSATGTYDAQHQFVVSYRTRDGSPGADVVVPLVTGSGPGLLVDRGWIPTENNASTPALPEPPTGQVTVTGWVRVDADAGADTEPRDGVIRAISAESLEASLPYELYDGFVELTRENPRGADSPLRAERPDLGSGPHFFYGMQWFFFAALAFGFWCYFAWAEYRARSAPAVRSG